MSSTGSGRQRVYRPRNGPRAMQACQSCAASKTKCDNNLQCRRCVKRNIPCVRQCIHGGHSLRADTSGCSPMTSIVEVMNSIHDDVAPEDVSHHDHEQSYSDNMQLEAASINAMVTPDKSTHQMSAPAIAEDGFGVSEEIRRAISYADWDLNFVQNLFNVDGEGPLDQADFLTPVGDIFGLDQSITVNQTAPSPISASPVVDDDKSLVVMDAFRKATGRWVPNAAVNLQAEEEKNLSATHGESITTDNSGRWDASLLPDGFPLSARDRLLAMVASACQPTHVLRVASTFPSCDGLCCLVRSFLAWQMSQDDTWIHVPTFSVTDVRVELLAAIVAAGAVRSPSRAVQKFGLAIHEVLQMQLRNIAQKSGMLTRDLQFLQAFGLEIHVGLWSGDKRKMEIAGGYRANIANMLRAGGRFRRFSYTASPPSPDDRCIVLENKWRQWIEQESLTRLVHHMHIHCSQDSLMTSAPTPLSALELCLAFPSARQLWLARTATEWKENFISLQHAGVHTHVSVVDCLADLSRLRHLPSFYDANVAQLSVIHGIAAMVQNYRNLQSSLTGIDSGLTTRESVLPDESQRRWMLKVFDSLHQTFTLCESGSETPPSILLALGFLVLHFNCSIDQMELLAGKEGFEEAQAAYAVLQRWIDSREARDAAWQAGQILKLVGALPLETVNDFHSVAVYHASLCLWAYGTIINKRRSENSSLMPEAELYSPATPQVLLDGNESLGSQRWIAFDKGRPVISNPAYGAGADVPPTLDLQSTDMVMQACIQIIRKKHPTRILLPPLTESLCYLMHALGISAQNCTSEKVL